MIFHWGDTRRYNAASNYLKKQFGVRVQKLTIDAGFTCPNRDGTIATGGCAFCNNNAFNPGYCNPEKSVSQQLDEGIEFHKGRYKTSIKYFAYFQAYSNTYAKTSVLRKLYYEALNHPDVIGLIIGTRPDCINDEVLDLFSEINKDYFLTVEYGIETVYNHTLQKINRGHSFEDSVIAIQKTAARGISTGGHIIFGLPGESVEMMLESASILSDLPLHSLKLHQLQIVRGSAFGELYLQNPHKFTLFTLDDYIEFICDFISILSPEIILERLAGEAHPSLNLGLKWNIRYDQVLQLIEKRLEEKNTWQGKIYNSNQKQL